MNYDPVEALPSEQVNWKGSHKLLSHGCNQQQKIFNFSNSVFNEVQSKDSDDIDEILTDLLLKVKEVEVQSLGSGNGFLSRLPMLEGMVETFKLFMARYENLSLPIEKDIMNLSAIREKVLQNAELIDNLSNEGQEILKDLSSCIEEGNLVLKEAKQQEKSKSYMALSNDSGSMKGIDSHEWHKAIEILSKRLKELDACQRLLNLTIPRISFISEVYRELAVKIQDSIFNLIPEWKNVILEIITLFRQKKAMQLQEELISSLNPSSHHSFIYSEEDKRNGLVNFGKIQEFNAQLIEGIETVLNKLKDFKTKRVTLESELIKLTSDLSLLSGNI